MKTMTWKQFLRTYDFSDQRVATDMTKPFVAEYHIEDLLNHPDIKCDSKNKTIEYCGELIKITDFNSNIAFYVLYLYKMADGHFEAYGKCILNKEKAEAFLKAMT